MLLRPFNETNNPFKKLHTTFDFEIQKIVFVFVLKSTIRGINQIIFRPLAVLSFTFAGWGNLKLRVETRCPGLLFSVSAPGPLLRRFAVRRAEVQERAEVCGRDLRGEPQLQSRTARRFGTFIVLLVFKKPI